MQLYRQQFQPCKETQAMKHINTVLHGLLQHIPKRKFDEAVHVTTVIIVSEH